MTLYTLYATADGGNGYTQKIGEYEDPTDIKIHCGHFAKDVVVVIEEEDKKEE